MAFGFATLGGEQVLGKGQSQGHARVKLRKYIDKQLMAAEAIDRFVEFEMRLGEAGQVACIFRGLHSRQDLAQIGDVMGVGPLGCQPGGERVEDSAQGEQLTQLPSVEARNEAATVVHLYNQPLALEQG